jgi:hypothetical protein
MAALCSDYQDDPRLREGFARLREGIDAKRAKRKPPTAERPAQPKNDKKQA